MRRHLPESGESDGHGQGHDQERSNTCCDDRLAYGHPVEVGIAELPVVFRNGGISRNRGDLRRRRFPPEPIEEVDDPVRRKVGIFRERYFYVQPALDSFDVIVALLKHFKTN